MSTRATQWSQEIKAGNVSAAGGGGHSVIIFSSENDFSNFRIGKLCFINISETNTYIIYFIIGITDFHIGLACKDQIISYVFGIAFKDQIILDVIGDKSSK